MANTIFSGVIRLRKDTEANFDLVKNAFIPADGEICLVELSTGEIKSKIGNGSSTFAQLEYSDKFTQDKIESIIARGYYYNGEFYADKQHIQKYVAYTYKLYVDIDEHKVYSYNGNAYDMVGYIPEAATSEKAGVMKLFNTLGANQDGSVTQLCITTELNKKVEGSFEGETLTLTNVISYE